MHRYKQHTHGCAHTHAQLQCSQSVMHLVWVTLHCSRIGKDVHTLAAILRIVVYLDFCIKSKYFITFDLFRLLFPVSQIE